MPNRPVAAVLLNDTPATRSAQAIATYLKARDPNISCDYADDSSISLRYGAHSFKGHLDTNCPFVSPSVQMPFARSLLLWPVESPLPWKADGVMPALGQIISLLLQLGPAVVLPYASDNIVPAARFVAQSKSFEVWLRPIWDGTQAMVYLGLGAFGLPTVSVLTANASPWELRRAEGAARLFVGSIILKGKAPGPSILQLPLGMQPDAPALKGPMDYDEYLVQEREYGVLELHPGKLNDPLAACQSYVEGKAKPPAPNTYAAFLQTHVVEQLRPRRAAPFQTSRSADFGVRYLALDMGQGGFTFMSLGLGCYPYWDGGKSVIGTEALLFAPRLDDTAGTIAVLATQTLSERLKSDGALGGPLRLSNPIGPWGGFGIIAQRASLMLGPSLGVAFALLVPATTDEINQVGVVPFRSMSDEEIRARWNSLIPKEVSPEALLFV